jgi:peptide/nickel transport system permease protein
MALASSVAPAPRAGVTSLPWVRFGVRRLGRLLVSLWVLVTASFLMIHLIPGDPVRAALGPTAPAALVAAKREEMGLDDPILVQYWHYLQGLFTGDLGTSLLSQLPVADVVAQRLPATLKLALLAFVVAVAIAVPLGVTMGVLTRRGHGRRTELAFSTSSIVVGIIPDFLIGVGLVYVFAVNLDWLPVAWNDTPSGVRPAGHRPGHRAGGRSSPASSGSRWWRCSRPTSCARRAPSGSRSGRSTSATPCPTR